MLNKDLHNMQLVMSLLYFTAGILSIITGILTSMFVFILLGICFIFTGVVYLYIYGLEREMMNKSKVNKVNLDDTRKFQKV